MFSDVWKDPEDKTKVESENKASATMASKVKADTASRFSKVSSTPSKNMKADLKGERDEEAPYGCCLKYIKQ